MHFREFFTSRVRWYYIIAEIHYFVTQGAQFVCFFFVDFFRYVLTEFPRNVV